MVKLDCTLPNLRNICRHKSIDFKFYSFFSNDNDLLEKIREVMTGGPSIVFKRKSVAIETFVRKSDNQRKSIVGIDVRQLYPYSMCQDSPAGLLMRWDYNEEVQKFMAGQNRV